MVMMSCFVLCLEVNFEDGEEWKVARKLKEENYVRRILLGRGSEENVVYCMRPEEELTLEWAAEEGCERRVELFAFAVESLENAGNGEYVLLEGGEVSFFAFGVFSIHLSQINGGQLVEDVVWNREKSILYNEVQRRKQYSVSNNFEYFRVRVGAEHTLVQANDQLYSF